MLYELWSRTVERHAADWAVHDLSSGCSWTYRELDESAKRHRGNEGLLALAQGVGVDFLFATIQGWRQGQVVCPLEPGQALPELESIPSECAHLKTTSATTGCARYVAFTAEQLLADANQIVATMGLRPGWPNLALISLAHSYGFSNLVLPLLLHGIPLVLGQSPLPEVLRQAAKVRGACTLPAVPALWRAWHHAGVLTTNIRLAISAGAPLPLALETEVFESTGIKIHNFYGASECGGIAYDVSNDPRSDETFAGQPLQGVNVAKSECGCLRVRSAAVGQTYWPEPGGALREGEYLTSDLVELNGGGVYLLGRATDVINVAGRKVVPELIERTLLGFDGIDGCLVFGVPAAEEAQGERIVAIVVAKEEPDLEALRRFLSARLPCWQHPRIWRRVGALQINARGKLSRAEWRARFLADDCSLRVLSEEGGGRGRS